MINWIVKFAILRAYISYVLIGVFAIFTTETKERNKEKTRKM